METTPANPIEVGQKFVKIQGENTLDFNNQHTVIYKRHTKCFVLRILEKVFKSYPQTTDNYLHLLRAAEFHLTRIRFSAVAEVSMPLREFIRHLFNWPVVIRMSVRSSTIRLRSAGAVINRDSWGRVVQ